MSITAALVLFAVVWFMVFFIVLPINVKSQAEQGRVVPGTPAGAPAGYVVKRKAQITTVAAVVIWGALFVIITSGWITVRDLDVMGRMPPLQQSN